MLLKKIHNRSPWLRLATIIRWNHTRTPAQWDYINKLVAKHPSSPKVKPETIPNKGVGLIATSNIEKGQLIYAEKPFCVVPKFQDNYHICKQCLRSRATFQDLTHNTAMEGRQDVAALSDLLEMAIRKEVGSCTCNQTQPLKLHEYLSQKTQGDPTMSNLMIKIYLQTIQKFNEHSQVKTNPAAAFLDAIGVVLDVICTILTPLLEPVANLMSFPFDGVASLPILEDKKLDQEWLKKNFSQNLSIPKHFEFFSYDQFFRYFIRVNLNYFEVTTCSPIFKLLQGEEKFWPTAAQQRHFQEQYKKSVHTLLGEWVDLQKNTKMLFGRGIGVYPLSALMNHHCKPNVEVRPHIDSTLHWYASKDINQGEELTITYCDLTLPMEQRQENLMGHHYFKCPCTTDCTLQNS